MAATSGDRPQRSSGRPEALSLGIPGIKVKSPIGSGIRGTVYSVTDGRCTLALKVLRRGIHVDREALSRLSKAAPNRIRHPNLAPIELMGELQDGSLYYATPFLRGDSLDRLLHDLQPGAAPRPSLSVFAPDVDGAPHPQLPTRGAELFAEALEGLAIVHTAGIVHRRLSPRNLHLTPRGRLMITDFGGDATTEAGDDLVYRAPEQLVPYPESVGPPADVYAMGVILYEALTGKRPFTAENPRELKESIREGRFDPPGAHAPNLPHNLEACVLKAMAFEPADRYRDAEAFAADLRRFLHGEEPIAARREEKPQPTGGHLRAARGDWLRVAAAAVILGAFVAWLWPRGDTPDARAVSLNLGIASKEPDAAPEAKPDRLVPQAQILHSRGPTEAVTAPPTVLSTSLLSDPTAQELTGGNEYAKYAALTRLRLEVEKGTRPRSDALLAAWAIQAREPTLRRHAIETLGYSADGDSTLRVLAIGEDLPRITLDAEAFYSLHDSLLRIADPIATRTICLWSLEESETVDRGPTPLSIHLDPNLRLEIGEGSPRNLTIRWIRARALIDPESLIEAVPHLAARDDVLAELIAALRSLGGPGAREALARIVREHSYSAGHAALSALRDLGAHAEVLDVAQGELPRALRAEAIRMLGSELGVLALEELRILAITSPEAELRRIAFASLSKFDDPEALAAIPAFIRDPELREGALEWAARISGDASTPVMIELLGENDFSAQSLAKERLKTAGPRDLLAPLVDRLLDSRPFTRECAFEVLLARGDLPRISEAIARIFGRRIQPAPEEARKAVAAMRGALEAVHPLAVRLRNAARQAVSRASSLLWAESGLSYLARMLLQPAQDR